MNIYLDNAATTRLDPKVLKKMEPYFLTKYGNPSSIHGLGQEAFSDLENARDNVAKIINGEASGVVFTSGATEANNLIIRGVALAHKTKTKNKIIISAIEHPCVKESAKRLEKEGFVVDYLPVDRNGFVDLKVAKEKVKEDALLVSVMAVNNEVGTIQKIKELASIAHEKGAYFHTDAVQAVPYLKIDIKNWNVDFLSLSAHKFYGPKGVGVAYINPSIKIKPSIVGGGQENNIRSGTHNMPGIIGLSEALSISYKERDKYIEKVKDLRDYFLEKVKKEIPEVKLNGVLRNRVPANLNLMFGYIEGEAILMDLSQKGIHVSTGSACSASDLRASYVLKEMGLNDNFLNSNIRFSFGRFNNKKEIDYTVKSLKDTVKRLREFSPIV